VSAASIYRKDFKFLADLGAKEAEVLLKSGKQHGAYYLAGYAVECALKACIAKKNQEISISDKARPCQRTLQPQIADARKCCGAGYGSQKRD
jgi:HEPN domain-containing protein